MMTYYVVTMVAFGSLLAAAGQLMFKEGAEGRVAVLDFANWWIVSGLFAYGISTILWIAALSRLKLTTVYPFTALTFLLVYLGAHMVYREKIGVAGLGGTALILVGLFLVVQDS